MTVSRRAFLRALPLAGATGTIGRARATHFEHQSHHVTLTYDETTLRTYWPRLDLSAVRANPSDGPPNALYAWIARSPIRETGVAVYWAEYDDQFGLLDDGRDSHAGDHEPIYVAFSTETGEVTEVVYAALHWVRGRTTDPPLVGRTHPTLSVVSPWHHYVPGTLLGGEFVELADLTVRYPAWLDTGLEAPSNPASW